MARKEKRTKKKLNLEELQIIEAIQAGLRKMKLELNIESVEIESDNGFNKKYNIVIKEVTY